MPFIWRLHARTFLTNLGSADLFIEALSALEKCSSRWLTTHLIFSFATVWHQLTITVCHGTVSRPCSLCCRRHLPWVISLATSWNTSFLLTKRLDVINEQYLVLRHVCPAFPLIEANAERAWSKQDVSCILSASWLTWRGSITHLRCGLFTLPTSQCYGDTVRSCINLMSFL